MTDEIAPALRRAAQNFRDTVTRDGGSVSITMGDKTVHIGPRAGTTSQGDDQRSTPRIPTADGTVSTEHNEGDDTGAQLDLKDPEGTKSRNRPGGMNVGRLKSFIGRS